MGRVIIDELEFEAPYGKLVAKTWGEESENCKRVLALHGWMDNAGSFDNLIPLLRHKDGLYVVGLDLPGHGKSSQMPPGSSYSDLGLVMDVRRFIIELGWNTGLYADAINEINLSAQNRTDTPSQDIVGRNKFTILGHSFGAGLALFYACLYPEDVEEIVLLDFFKPRTMSSTQLLRKTASSIDSFIKITPGESKTANHVSSSGGDGSNSNGVVGVKATDKGQVVVSYEAAIIATIEAHKPLGSFTRDNAACLLKRSTIAINSPPNSVIYFRDLRLQAMLNLREHIDIIKVMFSSLECRVLVILSREGIYAEGNRFMDQMQETQEFFHERAKSFNLEWVDADHYLHMNKQHETSEIINKYFESAHAQST